MQVSLETRETAVIFKNILSAQRSVSDNDLNDFVEKLQYTREEKLRENSIKGSQKKKKRKS